MDKQNQQGFFLSKRFLPLFVTQFFGAFNDNAFKNAFLIWFTYEAFQYSDMKVELVVTLSAGLFILPFLLFSATSGQLADKYQKIKIALFIKWIEILLMILAGAFFHLKSTSGLLVILFLMGMHSTFFGPIKYSLLPEHLKDKELVKGNAYIEGATFLSILLGTIFGGITILSVKGINMFSIFVVLFAIIGWISCRSIPQAKINDPSLIVGWNIFKETWKIIGYAREKQSVWLSIIGISWLWAIGITFLTQFPIYTKDVLGGNEQIVTLLLTVFTIGIGIGSLLCGRLLKGEINGRMVPIGSAGISISILLFKVCSYWYSSAHLNGDTLKTLSEFSVTGIHGASVLFSLLMLAIFSGIYVVPLYAIMQHRSDQKFMSRIIAGNNVMNALFMVLASVITAILFAMHLDVTNVLFLVGIVNIPIYFTIRRMLKR